MKSHVTGMNRSGSSEVVKEAPERYDSTQTTFPEHLLLETRVGDFGINPKVPPGHIVVQWELWALELVKNIAK